MKAALEYAKELIRFDSVSSISNVPVTDRVEEWLKELGMEVERIDFDDPRGVRKANVIGKLGPGRGGMAYFGHTDVVPVTNWKCDHGPFEPTVRDGRLYGRGSTDMKGSVACMLAAVASVAAQPLRAPVYLCCTADEEVGMLGAEQVATHSRLYREIVEGQSRSIIGEPTSLGAVHGHKGGCVMTITSRGRAAHSSLRDGINANWKMIPFLNAMASLYEELESDPRWRNEEFDPPTMRMNIGINDYSTAINITAPQSVCTLYFRAMPGQDTDPVIARIQECAEENGLEFVINFRARPFYTDPNSPFVRECLEFAEGGESHTVGYGTDAARFGELTRCLVMGPGDIAQAHTNDEWIALADLERGTDLYRRMLQRWCC